MIDRRLAALALVVLGGCASLSSNVRTRASLDLGCPEREIEVVPLPAGAMRARGCGLTETYVCGRNGICAREARDVVVTDAGERSDESVLRALEAARPGLERCVASGALRVRFTIDPSGHVTYAAPADESDASARACVRSAFFDVAIPEPAAAPRTVVLRVPPGWASPTDTSTVSASSIETVDEPTPTPAVPEAVDEASEATLRAAIDARRAAVLACAGTSTVALVVTYAADGSTAVTLRGALAGTDEERCVRSALTGVRVDPPPAAAGSMIHAVSSGD